MISIYRDFSEIHILSCCFPERKTYINRYKAKNQAVLANYLQFYFLFISNYSLRYILYILLKPLSKRKTQRIYFMHYAICLYAILNQQKFIVVFAQETGQNRVFGKKTACSQTTCLETGLNFIYSTDKSLGCIYYGYSPYFLIFALTLHFNDIRNDADGNHDNANWQ